MNTHNDPACTTENLLNWRILKREVYYKQKPGVEKKFTLTIENYIQYYHNKRIQ